MSYAVKNDATGWRAVNGIGDCAEDETWQEAEPSIAPAPIIPQVVSRFQGRAALLQAGKLQQIQNYIDLPTTDAFVKLAWNEVTEFRRQSPMIAVVTSVLGMTNADLDALFLAASQIEA